MERIERRQLMFVNDIFTEFPKILDNFLQMILSSKSQINC